MVGVHGAGGDDVIFVLVHQRQLGVVTPCIRKSQGKKLREKRSKESESKEVCTNQANGVSQR